jgi:hypothetical protein
MSGFDEVEHIRAGFHAGAQRGALGQLLELVHGQVDPAARCPRSKRAHGAEVSGSRTFFERGHALGVEFFRFAAAGFFFAEPDPTAGFTVPDGSSFFLIAFHGVYLG